MTLHKAYPRYIWKTQLPVDYLDTSLTINNFETVNADLGGNDPVRLWYILVEQTNNGATAEDIELEITINGTAYTWTASCASGVINFGRFTYQLSAGDFETNLHTTANTVGGGEDADQSVPFIAETVGLIRVRQTSTVDGTAAQIEVNIKWDKLEAV